MKISDYITEMARKSSVSIGTKLENQFINKKFGLLFIGLPEAVENVYVTKGTELKIQSVTDPMGKHLIKLCADPQIFDINYPNQINGTMSGLEIILMVKKIPNIDGVLICSATSFNSYPIYRDKLDLIYEKHLNINGNDNNPWWKFWR